MTKCKEEKSLFEFNNHKNGKYGKHHYCKICLRSEKNERYKNNEVYQTKIKENNYKRNYNLTLETRNKLLEQQGGCCKICDKNLNINKKSTHIDHCHKTGEVRGILCNNCNTTLGKVNEDIVILKKMIEYIEINKK